MASNLSNVPYLRVQRKFPQEIEALTVEVDRSYVDIANAVNNRTIGIFTQGSNTVNGESWFITSARQQGLRRIYNITATGNTAHGLNFSSISRFTKIYGTFTDGTNWYPLPYVDVTNANNQVSLSITSTNIVITPGAGSPPSLTSGTVILEWIGAP